MRRMYSKPQLEEIIKNLPHRTRIYGDEKISQFHWCLIHVTITNSSEEKFYIYNGLGRYEKFESGQEVVYIPEMDIVDLSNGNQLIGKFIGVNESEILIIKDSEGDIDIDTSAVEYALVDTDFDKSIAGDLLMSVSIQFFGDTGYYHMSEY